MRCSMEMASLRMQRAPQDSYRLFTMGQPGSSPAGCSSSSSELCSPVWGRGSLRKLLAAVLVVCAPSGVSAQAPGRIATTPQALLASPLFFHGKQIAVRGQVAQAGEQVRLQVAVD